MANTKYIISFLNDVSGEPEHGNDNIIIYVAACFPGPQEATHHINHDVPSQGYRESVLGLLKSRKRGELHF